METLLDWISNLKKSEKLILVEGKKDKAALEKLGVKKIITNSKPIYSIIEEITNKGEKECILLFDLDKEGRKIYSVYKKQLQRNGIKIDRIFREFLFSRTRLTQIEGITHYLKNNY